MTIGELAGFVNEEHEVGADLDVVELRGWDRDMWYDETGLPWVPSIPQLSHLEKALIYPATVLLEGTNVTPGWGTGRGPMLAGAPWLDRQETVRSARENIESAGLSGVGIRSDRFRPRHGVIPQYVDTVCDGFQIHVTDRDTFRPLATGLCLLAAIHDANDEFEWTTREFRDETVFWTDQLAGTEKYRQRISEAEPIADVIAATTEGLEEYRGRYEQQLRY